MEQKNLYIPGDLVMTNGVPLGTAEGVVYRVTVTDPNKTLRLKDGTVLKGTVCLENIDDAELGDKGYLMCECYAWVKDIVPIRLTIGTLQENGYKKERIYYTNKFIPRIKLCTCEEGYEDKWSVSINGDIIGGYIYHVHQLQHILFGLGLDSNIKL